MPLPALKGSGKKAASRGVSSPGQRRADHQAANMGNGASASHIVVEGEHFDLAKIKELLPQLRKQLKLRDEALERTQMELVEARMVLKERDADLNRYKEEVHKLKSVLQATLHKDGKPDILSTIHEDAAMAGQEVRKPAGGYTKKQGVSGESSGSTTPGLKSAEIKHFPKDFK